MVTSGYRALEQETLPADFPLREKLGKFFSNWYSRLVIFCGLLGVILLVLWILYPGRDATPSKRGAGLLLVADNQVLLLLRSNERNEMVYSLPGGDAVAAGSGDLETATRAATEDLGHLPDFQVLMTIVARQQNVFVVFVCNVTSPPQEYSLQLNREHHAVEWFNAADAAQLKNLDPVVAALFQDPARKKLAAFISAQPPPFVAGQSVEKRGAGFLFMCGGQALLLTRNSTNGNNTLAIPGGNVDLQDTHLLATATREAEEEMGSCPEYEPRGEISFRRGKRNQKDFTVYFGVVTAETKASFTPILSHESLAWGWYPLDKLKAMRSGLHVVTEVLLQDHLQEVEEAFAGTLDEGD